ncbi:unnamed protein product [Ranitomeya imitator]|uniref:Chromo domain-containing protein n=1 Tax=Ranitomeya imitator TaxID=111125 RepID=A0ABN9M466_9NEOB|nr:unnamed protein product [Ranitomeya imitator]
MFPGAGSCGLGVLSYRILHGGLPRGTLLTQGVIEPGAMAVSAFNPPLQLGRVVSQESSSSGSPSSPELQPLHSARHPEQRREYEERHSASLAREVMEKNGPRRRVRSIPPYPLLDRDLVLQRIAEDRRMQHDKKKIATSERLESREHPAIRTTAHDHCTLTIVRCDVMIVVSPPRWYASFQVNVCGCWWCSAACRRCRTRRVSSVSDVVCVRCACRPVSVCGCRWQVTRGCKLCTIMSLLRRYVAPVVPSIDPPAPVLVEGELEYIVEKILDSRVSRRKLQYLVKWKGYGQEDNSWVFASDVHAADLVRAFHVAHPGRPGGSGPGRFAVVNGTINSAVYQEILKENVRPSVRDFKLKRTCIMQQDNDPKHTSKSTCEWLKKNKMKTLEWPSQSPDLNLIEML